MAREVNPSTTMTFIPVQPSSPITNICESKTPNNNGYLELEGNPESWIENNTPSTHLLVKYLDLGFWGINEENHEIGDSIDNLTFLTHLTISYSKPFKSLPNSMSNLHMLNYLEFSDCYFENLPPNLGVLKTSLTNLNIFECDNIKSLTQSVSTLSNLSSLHLRCCDSLTELPTSLNNLLKLELLSIEKCDSLTELPINLNVKHLKLMNSSIEFIPCGLVNLRHLEIESDILSQCCFTNLKDSANLNRLTFFCGCEFDSAISDFLVNLKQLGVVSIQILWFRTISSDDFVFKLPDKLEGLDELVLLDIEEIRIKYLPWSITELRKLKCLMLPRVFTLETLPSNLNDSVVISVKNRHVRKTWEELRQELILPSFPVVSAQYPSNISLPGYLQLVHYSLMLVKILEFTNLNGLDGEMTKIALRELSKLTHLYICGCKDNYWLPDTITGLRHLSLRDYVLDFRNGNLSNLSNLESLDLIRTDLPENMDLPINLKRLSFYHSYMHSLPNIMEKLPNLISLELCRCDYLNSMPENLNIVRLKLDRIIDSLPLSLRHLEIFHYNGTFCNTRKHSDCVYLEKCFTELVNLETLSITCYYIESLPSIARLQNLRVFQLKDCFNLRQLPSDLGELIKLDTLNISGTRIKSLPNSISKLHYLKHVILPKCFGQESLLRNSQGFIIDNMDEIYYTHLNYYDSRYETSPEPCHISTNLQLTHITDVSATNQNSSCNSVIQDEKTSTLTSAIEYGLNKNPQRGIEKGKQQKILITRETIQQLMSKKMRLVDSAKQLQVSRSTLKRRLKELEIKWLSSKKTKPRFNVKMKKLNSKTHCRRNSLQKTVDSTNTTNNDNVREYTLEESQLTLPSYVMTHDSSMGNVKDIVSSNIGQQDGSSNNFILKATYYDDTVRFEFSCTYSFEQLKQELGKRLELEVGTFRIKYQDEDNEWIRMSCISDLEYALHLSKSSGLNYVRLSIFDERFLNGEKQR